ncbi:hypothetical protein [Proteocatella sphenisci]|nr:hypothetical protein [Proteocatella sphenisci]
MGEIVVSIFIGGWMMLVGVFMHWSLSKEEKKYRQEELTAEASANEN